MAPYWQPMEHQFTMKRAAPPPLQAPPMEPSRPPFPQPQPPRQHPLQQPAPLPQRTAPRMPSPHQVSLQPVPIDPSNNAHVAHRSVTLLSTTADGLRRLPNSVMTTLRSQVFWIVFVMFSVCHIHLYDGVRRVWKCSGSGIIGKIGLGVLVLFTMMMIFLVFYDSIVELRAMTIGDWFGEVRMNGPGNQEDA